MLLSHEARPLRMCYSAQVWANYRKYVREFGATISVEEFAILYFHDKAKTRPKTPKAMDDAFAAGETPEERAVWREIQQWNLQAATAAERELFTQTTRLNTAQRALQTKVTKKAQEDVRIATNKIEAAKQKLADLRRTDDPLPRDSRVFPGVYAPVMIWEDGSPSTSTRGCSRKRGTSPRSTQSSTTSATRSTSTGLRHKHERPFEKRAGT